MTEQELNDAIASLYGVSGTDLQLQVRKEVQEQLTFGKPIIILRAKSKRNGHKPSGKSEWHRDSLEKASFAPNNSRIGRESRGLQSKHNRDNLGSYAQIKAATLKRLLVCGVSYSLDANAGILETTVHATIEQSLPEPKVLSKFIGPQRDAVQVRTGKSRQEYATDAAKQLLLRKNINTQTVKDESKQWKTQRTPRQGQRAQVLLQSRAK